MATVERAQPLLGTCVAIRVDDVVDGPRTHEAITAAFDEIGTVHRLMSFYDTNSDVSRLNRDAFGGTVHVDRRTADVLRAAGALHRASGGVFDVSVGGDLASRGALPRHWSLPGRAGFGTDILVGDDDVISFVRPLWIDLGGIAKGYAADRAAEVLRRHGIGHARVDAGGDLRLLGPGPHRVFLDAGQASNPVQAVLDLGDGAVATSSNRSAIRHRNALGAGIHLDGRTRADVAPDRTVSVIASDAMHADALAKIVMALGSEADAILRRFDATAYVCDAAGWYRVQAA